MIRWLPLLALLWMLLPRPAGAACDQPWSARDLGQELDKAETAFRKQDVQDMRESSEAIRDAIPCLDEPITPQLALRTHRVLGLYHLKVRQDQQVARYVFAAARAVDDRYPPTDLFPPGSPEMQVYTAMSMADPRLSEIEDDGRTTWYINGGRSMRRPRTWPAIAQGVDRDGDICRSTYLWAEDELEPCAGGETVADRPPRTDGRPRRGFPISTAGIVGAAGGVALITGGSLYAGAWIRHGQYKDTAAYTPAYHRDVIRPWAATGLVVAGIGLGAIGGAGAWVALDESQRPLLRLSGSW